MSEWRGDSFFPGVPCRLDQIVSVHRRGPLLVVSTPEGACELAGGWALFRPLCDALREVARHSILSSRAICPVP